MTKHILFSSAFPVLSTWVALSFAFEVGAVQSLEATAGKEPGGFTPEITTNDLHSIVSYLASDKLEGRLAGSTGAELAADYIAQRMKAMGLQPVGTNRDFFQSYEFTAGARVITNANSLEIKESGGKTVSFKVEKDFRPLAFSDS